MRARRASRIGRFSRSFLIRALSVVGLSGAAASINSAVALFQCGDDIVALAARATAVFRFGDRSKDQSLIYN
jgi:hypothetical protein